MTGNEHARLGQENPPQDEAETIAEILEFQLGLMRQLGPDARGQHPKGHGVVRAKFEVLDNIEAPLRHGVFRKPNIFPALIRFSNGFSQDDRAPDFHGMAIKLIGVPGEKLLESEREAQTHDFVLADTPVFFTANVKRLLLFMQQKVQLAMQGLGEADQMRALAKTCPREVELFLQHAKKPESTLLASSFWSCVPYRLGDAAAKYLVRPSTHEAITTDEPASDFLRATLAEHLSQRRKPAQFDFFVQRQTDPVSMPIEDATIEWNSPFEQVAKITIAPQDFTSEAQLRYGENLSFNPWRALPEHQPLGGLNRARRAVYLASSRLRHETNNKAMREPERIEDFPG